MKSIPTVIVVLATTLTAGLIWFSGWGAFIWLMGTKALPDDIGFGYYRDFNVARTAIEQAACVESIEYSRHEDFTLEDFHFQIRTRAGSFVRLWFNDRMDVEQVCLRPRGFVVLHPETQLISQGYTVAELSMHLTDKGIQVANLNDVLCNLDELARVFKANYGNEGIGPITYGDEDFNRYLHVEILDQEHANDFTYFRLR